MTDTQINKKRIQTFQNLTKISKGAWANYRAYIHVSEVNPVQIASDGKYIIGFDMPVPIAKNTEFYPAQVSEIASGEKYEFGRHPTSSFIPPAAIKILNDCYEADSDCKVDLKALKKIIEALEKEGVEDVDLSLKNRLLTIKGKNHIAGVVTARKPK